MRRKAECTLVSLQPIKRVPGLTSKENFQQNLQISFVKIRKIGGHSPVLGVFGPLRMTAEDLPARVSWSYVFRAAVPPFSPK